MSRIPVIYLGIATCDNCASAALAFHDGHFNMESLVVDLSDGSVVWAFEHPSTATTPSTASPPLSEWRERTHGDGYFQSCPLVTQPDDRRPHPQVLHILEAIRGYTRAEPAKILAAGVDSNCPFASTLCHSLWTQLDILPFSFALDGTIEERADSASRKSIMWFGPDRIPRLTIGFRNQVEVDGAGLIKLAGLADYSRTVTPATWKALTDMAARVKDLNIRFSFFNATPQGGGVALMRHSIMRLLRLLNVEAGWYVPKPSPVVFRITKTNHNILQGVSASDSRFGEQQQRIFEKWTMNNCERYWTDGPFQWSDVVILDDPQVAGFVPFIKRSNPECKIIYRSHIEIRSDLTKDPSTPQHELWQYLWNNYLKQCDLFIFHPIANFVRDTVPSDKVMMMAASTDPLDGLNKQLAADDNLFWIHAFNRHSFDQNGNRLAFPKRPFVVQVARFDPSKGYKDVLEAYRLLRTRISSTVDESAIPQLVLCGHGSVDDPDAMTIYSELVLTTGESRFDDIRSDICIVRVPPEDRILNAVMGSAKVALQLSHREGFEVKVTEALLHGTPVIAYDCGGIPLQLPPDYKYLVKIGDIERVADFLLELCMDSDIHAAAQAQVRLLARKDEYYSVWQTANWLWLVLKIADNEEQLNDGQKLHSRPNDGRVFVCDQWMSKPDKIETPKN